MFTTCAYFAVNAAGRDLSRVWDRAFLQLNLTASQAYMLVFVIRNPDVSLKAIGTQMNLEPSSVSRNIVGLERRGLVKRQDDRVDARIVRFRATERGERLQPQIVSISKDLNAEIRKIVGSRNLDSLSSFSLKVIEGLRGSNRAS